MKHRVQVRVFETHVTPGAAAAAKQTGPCHRPAPKPWGSIRRSVERAEVVVARSTTTAHVRTLTAPPLPLCARREQTGLWLRPVATDYQEEEEVKPQDIKRRPAREGQVGTGRAQRRRQHPAPRGHTGSDPGGSRRNSVTHVQLTAGLQPHGLGLHGGRIDQSQRHQRVGGTP